MRAWEKFTLQGDVSQDWIKDQAVGSIPVEEAKFATGTNFLVVYACSKTAAEWDCNGGKWIN